MVADYSQEYITQRVVEKTFTSWTVIALSFLAGPHYVLYIVQMKIPMWTRQDIKQYHRDYWQDKNHLSEYWNRNGIYYDNSFDIKGRVKHFESVIIVCGIIKVQIILTFVSSAITRPSPSQTLPLGIPIQKCIS